MECLDAVIDALAEGYAVELVLDRLVEPFTDTVGLGVAYFGSRVDDILQAQEELVRMSVVATAVFSAPVGDNAQNIHIVLFEKGHHGVVLAVRRRKLCFGIIEPGEGDRGMCIYYGLLVDTAHPLDIAPLLS